MPSLIEALAYLGIDYADESVRRNVARSLRAAEGVLRGAVGDDVAVYLPEDPRVNELVLIYLDDLYSERGVNAKVSGATRRLVESMETQLRLELRRRKEEAGAS